MFKSLALVATVSNAVIATLDGEKAQWTLAKVKVGSATVTNAAAEIACNARTGYKAHATDGSMLLNVVVTAQMTSTTTFVQNATTPTKVLSNKLQVMLQGPMTSATVTTRPTFGWVYNNGAAALNDSGTATGPNSSGVFYEETATAITGAVAVKVAIATPMTNSAAVSTITASTTSTVPTTGNDKWVLNQTNSIITVATATAMGIEGGISKNMIKATNDAWSKKEAFLAACEYAGALTDSSAWVSTGAKVSATGDWTFIDGAAATMAGASLVAAAALLF